MKFPWRRLISRLNPRNPQAHKSGGLIRTWWPSRSAPVVGWASDSTRPAVELHKRELVVDQLIWDTAEGAPSNGEYDFAAPYRGSDNTVESDLIDALARTSAFVRLGDVRFLGALDYFLVSKSRRYSRLQHSLGVASLAKAYLDQSHRHTAEQRLLCVAAAMLHDIGHPPFSHTLEPVFFEAFGLDHHEASEKIITGLTPIGAEVVATLRSFGVDPLAVLHLLNGGDDLFDNFFSGPINFDTIEGILRARSYLKMQKLGLSPLKVLKAATARGDVASQEVVDGFWRSKHDVYTLVIRSKWGVFYDSLFQAIAREHIQNLSPKDLFATESDIFRRIPKLAETLKPDRLKAVAQSVLPQELTYQLRKFYVESASPFDVHEDSRRYRQVKSPTSLTIEDILRG